MSCERDDNIDNIKIEVGGENAILTNLNATDCCQTTTNEKKIYFPANSCKLQNHTGSSKIRSLKSALLGEMHALLHYNIARNFCLNGINIYHVVRWSVCVSRG